MEFDSPWWPFAERRSVPVTARMSRGAGLPAGVPDVPGLAVQIPLDSATSATWDLTLASSGFAPGSRLLPLPARGWHSARYSSLMPYSAAGDAVPQWVLAAPDGRQPRTTATSALTEFVNEAPLRFRLYLTTALGAPQPAGSLVLDSALAVADGRQPSFDPVHCPAGYQLYPHWLATARLNAYRGSRRGRQAADGDASGL